MDFSLKNNKKIHLIILGVLAVFFFFIYSFLIFGNELYRFTWPDETANYFFITNYIESGSFSAHEPLNKIADNLIKPRSFNVYQENLVPGSFLGMLLIYGLIGKIIGPNLILFLTPFLAVLAGIYFYKLMLKIFQPNISFLAALLFFVNPAWWYYAGLTMLPNISFVCFLIIGFYYLFSLNDKFKHNIWMISLGSFFLALALIIRTNEIIWIGAVLFFLVLVYWRKLKWYYILIFLVVNLLVFSPIFFYNQQTYGSALSFGYLKLEQGDNLASQLPPEFKTSQQGNWFDLFKFSVLPFGFSPGSIISNTFTYYIDLFWWLFIPAIIGLFALVKNWQKQNKAVYLVVSLLIGCFLLVYYGSWVFADQMTVTLNKIGLSYVRYWLPIYILALPLVVICYLAIINLVKNNKLKILLTIFIIFTNLYFCLNLVYWQGNDNLLKIKQNINDYQQINRQIVQLTENDAIIISERSDKIFFPQRKVISKWQIKDAAVWSDLLQNNIPLYYYAYEGNSYIVDFNYNLNQSFGLQLLEIKNITDKEKLYQIKFINNE